MPKREKLYRQTVCELDPTSREEVAEQLKINRALLNVSTHKFLDLTSMANESMGNRENVIINYGVSINQKRNKKTSKITKMIATGFKT